MMIMLKNFKVIIRIKLLLYIIPFVVKLMNMRVKENTSGPKLFLDVRHTVICSSPSYTE